MTRLWLSGFELQPLDVSVQLLGFGQGLLTLGIVYLLAQICIQGVGQKDSSQLNFCDVRPTCGILSEEVKGGSGVDNKVELPVTWS